MSNKISLAIGYLVSACIVGIPSILYAEWYKHEANQLSVVGGIPYGGVPYYGIINGTQTLLYRNGCTSEAFLPLTTWLLTYGIFLFGYTVPAAIVGFIFHSNDDDWTVSVIALVIVYVCFDIAWLVVGAVILGVYSGTCYSLAHGLWGMSLAALVIQGCSIASILYTKRE